VSLAAGFWKSAGIDKPESLSLATLKAAVKFRSKLRAAPNRFL
jgi:hypothetical protein